jgi:hypothetical protein
MIANFRPVSIFPIDGDGHSNAFLEVIAYLRGVADTVTAQSDTSGPLSLLPASLCPRSPRPSTVPAASLPPALLRQASLPPLSLAPEWSGLTRSDGADAQDGRTPLRFGDLPFDRGSVWPQVAVGSSWEPTRGGARLIDPGSVLPVVESDARLIWRRTLPYGAPTVSLAACPSSIPAWDDSERPSEVRLRAAELPREWYELTGTERGATAAH